MTRATIVVLLAAFVLRAGPSARRADGAPPPAKEVPPAHAYGEKREARGPFETPCIFGAAQYADGGEGKGYHRAAKGYGPFPPGHGGQQWLRHDDARVDWAYWDKAADGSQKGHWEKDGGTLCLAGGGDFTVWLGAGEWLAYDLSVAEAGPYAVVLRVCNGAGEGAALHLELDGKRAGDWNVPATQSWHHFADLTVPGVRLTAGRHQLKVVCDRTKKGEEVPQLHYLTVAPDKAPAPAPPSRPRRP